MSRHADIALEPIERASPIAPFFGGKKHLSARIIARIEAIPHRCYVEPFVGMGGVFLRRGNRPKVEAINDRNGEIANLFRIMKEHPEELCRQFDCVIWSRQEFCRWVMLKPGTLTDIQRAARFASMQRMTFGGKPATHTSPGQIGPSPHQPSRLTGKRMRRLIRAAHRRLQGVYVECLDWPVLIERWDRPFTLFYADPPYWGHERDYGKGMFAREDFARMAEVLSRIKGRFILSLGDEPEVRELFADFQIEQVDVRYSACAKSPNRLASELLISGGG